jgi:hypothetical protein
MKICVITNDKGKILTAVLPAPKERQGKMVSCGPSLRGNQTLSEIALPKGTTEKDLVNMLARSHVKRVKGESVLVTRSDAPAQHKKPRANAAKKSITKKAKKR